MSQLPNPTDRDSGGIGVVLSWLGIRPFPVWFTLHLELRKVGGGVGAWAKFQPSASPGAGLQGCREEGSRPKLWPPHNTSRDPKGSVPVRTVGSSATTRPNSSVLLGSRCNEKWPPEPSWSQHCRFSESALALCSSESRILGAAS